MVKIKLRIAGNIVGQKQIQVKEIKVSKGATVADLLEQLRLELGGELLGPTMLVVVNGRSVPEMRRKDWPLQENDVVSLVRSFGGG